MAASLARHHRTNLSAITGFGYKPIHKKRDADGCLCLGNSRK
jgi:hypothetical protein